MDKKENQWKYCWKDDTALEPALTRYEKGSRDATQGKRNDIVKARDMIMSGGKLIDLVDDDDTLGVVAKYPQFVEMIRTAYLRKLAKKNKWQPKEIHVYWGDTGTGKSRKAHWEAEQLFGDEVFKKSKDKDWFCGYDGEPALIIDEFYGAEFTPAALLGLLDGYPYDVNKKRLGASPSGITHVWITSNVHPRDWWGSANIPTSVREALARRITTCTHFDKRTGKWEPPTPPAYVESTESGDELVMGTPEPVVVMENQEANEWFERVTADLSGGLRSDLRRALNDEEPLEGETRVIGPMRTPAAKRPRKSPEKQKRIHTEKKKFNQGWSRREREEEERQ